MNCVADWPTSVARSFTDTVSLFSGLQSRSYQYSEALLQFERDELDQVPKVATLVEAAIAAGYALAQHQIVSSMDFERLMNNLHRAAELLDRIAIERERRVIIPFTKRDTDHAMEKLRLSARSAENSLPKNHLPKAPGD